MEIRDIHTHLLPQEPGTALVCIGSGPLPAPQGHWFSVGLHPWDVTGDDEKILQSIGEMAQNPQVLAIGECGFDTLKGPAHDLQEQAFIRQVEISERVRKPMILHVVRDFDSVIRLRKQLKPTQSWLIHGFRGGPQQADQLHTHGIQVSLGLKANPQTLQQIPSDRLFLETDGLCPITHVIQTAAAARNQSAVTIEEQIINNSNVFLLQEP
jgi:TatD DNase family protein